jgi:AcrR family transcriptional regulator
LSGEARPAARADARRNRARRLDAAAVAFAAGAPVSLEAVAADAGVGIGTLYRHFATREALVEAVYAEELAHICVTAEELALSESPERALRTWMDRYADFVATKRGMAETLRAALAAGVVGSDTRERIVAAVGTLLTAGAAAGTLRADVDPEDVVVGLIGIVLATAQEDQRAQAGRLMDLLMAGLRTTG